MLLFRNYTKNYKYLTLNIKYIIIICKNQRKMCRFIDTFVDLYVIINYSREVYYD